MQISSLGLYFKRVVGLASVGRQQCNGLGLLKRGSQFSELYVIACWGKLLSEFNIRFKNAYSGSKGERLLVLQELVKKKEVDVGRDKALTLYTEALLLGMLAKVDEGDEVIVENFQESMEKINAAFKIIERDGTVMDHIEKMLGAVCPYNYHVLQFILSHLTKGCKENAKFVKADRILGFLMHYTRVSEPVAEFEVDPWLKDRREAFPHRLAKLRLPLTSMTSLSQKEKFKLLEKEFTMDTHKAWMSVSGVMGLNTDNILYYVVKNTVSSIMEQQTNPGEGWVLGHVNRSMLEEIQQCIRLMKEPEKAAAASFWVLNRLPQGSDKVLASVGMEETVRVLAEGAAGAQEQLEHAVNTRRQLETEQALHKYDLAKQPYLDIALQQQPITLINSLFEDSSIEERSLVAAGQYPDIGAAAEAIASIHELSLVKIKYSLLDSWLPLQTSAPGGADDTMADFTLNLNNVGNDTGNSPSSLDEVNLLRCVYLLQTGFEGGLQYLLKYAFATDPLVTTSHRLRATKCLFSLCSEEELETAIGQPVEVLKEKLRSLTFLCRLEALGLPYNEDSLQGNSVSQLVEGVWRTCRLSPQGVTLTRDLCAEFEVWSPDIWSALLLQMIKFSMLGELRPTLKLLNRQPALWTVPGFLPAWEMAILAPVAALLSPPDEQGKELCRNQLKLLQHCPAAGELNLAKLAR